MFTKTSQLSAKAGIRCQKVKSQTCTDAQAVSFVFAHFEHLLVDVTDHGPGLLLHVSVLCRVVVRNVLPRGRLQGTRRPPLLPLLLRADVIQEAEGDVTWPQHRWGVRLVVGVIAVY